VLHSLRGTPCLAFSKNTAYRKAVENSQRQGEDHLILSPRLWFAPHAFKIRADLVESASLSQNDQSLAEDYEGG